MTQNLSVSTLSFFRAQLSTTNSPWTIPQFLGYKPLLFSYFDCCSYNADCGQYMILPPPILFLSGSQFQPSCFHIANNSSNVRSTFRSLLGEHTIWPINFIRLIHFLHHCPVSDPNLNRDTIPPCLRQDAVPTTWTSSWKRLISSCRRKTVQLLKNLALKMRRATFAKICYPCCTYFVVQKIRYVLFLFH